MRYKFCSQLKNCLFFACNEILHCCPGVANSGPKFAKHYSGKIFDKNEIIEQKKIASEKSKKGKYPYRACKTCYKYHDNDWDEDFRINDISISHWTECNAKCFYCFTVKDKDYLSKRKPYKILPVLKNIKDIIDFSGIVRFIGGDVVMLAEFEEIIDFFVENGCKNFFIPTSGIKYLPTVENLLKQGIAQVSISIDSGSKRTYKTIKQVDCFDLVSENMRKYAKAAKEGNTVFESKYIIIPNINNNKKEILKWIKMCSDLGINRIAIDFENSYLQEKPDKIPANIYDILELIKTTANKRDIHYSYWNYLEQLLFGLEKGIYQLDTQKI